MLTSMGKDPVLTWVWLLVGLILLAGVVVFLTTAT